MKSKDLYNKIVKELLQVYDSAEAASIASLLLEELVRISKTDLLTTNELDLTPENEAKIGAAIDRLKTQEPLQYVLGKAHFYGRDFIVTPDVLIPRRETEELVYLVLKELRLPGARLLDIGTGSGCIPITLKLEQPQLNVEALDLSTKALAIALSNAKLLEASVVFHHFDILSDKMLPNKYDVIVSNPPYVTEKEKLEMRANVLDHEPHLALFVKDDNPLLFYKAIAQKASMSLNADGKLYFEINEQFGDEVADVMRTVGFEKLDIIQDMQGKDRIVWGTLA